MTTEIPSISPKKAKNVIDYFQDLKKMESTAVKAKTTHDRPTVIIIGAGIAGIAAAKELTNLGFYVTLLESRDRIGGRIYSQEIDNGIIIELGAQFLHGIKENPLFKLCGDYDIKLKPYSRSDWSVYDSDGYELDRNRLMPLINKYKKTLQSLSQERLSDTKDRFLVNEQRAFEELVAGLPEEEARKLSPIAKIISQHELHEESVFAYKTAINKKESESNFLVTSGYVNLLKGMLDDTPKEYHPVLHLSSEVQDIQHSSDEIMVTCKNGKTYYGDAIICTLPLGVLQRGSVTFTPPLHKEKLKAINNLGCSVHNKVILEFEESFWGNQSHYLIPFDPEMEAWLDIINLAFFMDKKTPVLVCSIHTHLHQKQLFDEQSIDHIVKLIKKIFPDSFKPLKNAWVTHWDQDPFSLGSYSYHPEGSSLDDNSEIAKPVGRLVFAGEHTHRSPSNIQGAYLSGLEAAKQIVEQLYFIFKTAGKF